MGEVDEELEELLAEEVEEDSVEEEDHVVAGHPKLDKSFDQVVDEVRRGLWGKGQARRLALSQAGYDHVAVQKAVLNKINGR